MQPDDPPDDVRAQPDIPETTLIGISISAELYARASAICDMRKCTLEAVIEDLIVKLREQVAVVIVTHNLQQAYRIADHVGFMYLGELVEYATAKALFGSPRQQRTKDYVGSAFG